MPAFLFFVANAVILWQSIFDEAEPLIYAGVIAIFFSCLGALGALFQKFNGRR